jgi:hypothetical protein
MSEYTYMLDRSLLRRLVTTALESSGFENGPFRHSLQY